LDLSLQAVMVFYGLNRIQIILVASFIGLVMFIILAMDRPFRVDLGLSAAPYQLIYARLMKQ